MYNNTVCDQVVGSDGAQFPPDVGHKDTLQIFSGDTCRPIYMSFDKETSVKKFKTLRFKIKSFDDKHMSGENCFCTQEDGCYGEGLMDVSPCKQDAPISISKPHFLGAERHLKNISGLSPTPEKHDPWIDVEPWTGIPLEASIKFQVNIKTSHGKDFLHPITYPNKIVPLMWFQQNAVVTDESVAKLNEELFSKITLFRAVASVMIVVGIIGVIIAIIFNRQNILNNILKYLKYPKHVIS